MFSPLKLGTWLLAGLALGCVAAPAQAQVFGAPGFGGFRTNVIYPGGGLIYPGGAVPGLSYSYYNSGWSSPYPFFPGAYNASSTILMPGFAASDMPRSRPSLYPAIRLPEQGVIKQAIYGSDDDEQRATITIRVPSANAKVYIDGVLMKQTGLDRTFVTPKLDLKKHYTLEARVTWQDATGENRTVVRQLGIRPGRIERLDLSLADL